MTIEQLLEALTEARRRGLPPETPVLLGFEDGGWPSEIVSDTVETVLDGTKVLCLWYGNDQTEVE